MVEETAPETVVAARGESAGTNELHGGVVGASVQARSIYGDVQFNVGQQAGPPIPAQLPCVGLVVARHEELAKLCRFLEAPPETGSSLIVVITGTGGVGKTTLGLRWLHQIRARYGDGQLFVDLRGFSGRRPMEATKALERFLRALGVDAGTMPTDVDERAALFSTLTADRRLIVMLDNAASAAEVRPLLPGPGPALVVVTTRHRLSGLAPLGARFLEVGPLNAEGAVELLNRLLGADRVREELKQAFTLVALCGGLPLAVCASGARLAARRRWPIARVVRELADETQRLATLGDDAEAPVLAVFNASYFAITDEDARRLYRLLGLHPGADFDAGAAAALLTVQREEGARLLDVLAGASLLQEGADDRYHFHDLLRLHARGLALKAESSAERYEALARLSDWYLRTAVAADLIVLPGRWHLGSYYAPERRQEVEGEVTFDRETTAVDWLERERINLVAVARHAYREGRHEVAWQICEALGSLFLLSKHYWSWTESHQIGLAAARACGNAKAQALMLTRLGIAHLNRRDLRAAIDVCGQALELDPPGGHPLGEASALEGLGIAELATGNGDRAIDFFTQARTIHEELHRSRGTALMNRHLGEALTSTGRATEAIEHFSKALSYFNEADERYHQARTLTGLAGAHASSKRLDAAAEVLKKALRITEQIGARHEQAAVHVALADLAERRSESEKARDHLRIAWTIYSEHGAPQVEEVRKRLAALSIVGRGER